MRVTDIQWEKKIPSPRVLNGEETADANRDGFLTASELGLFLNDRVTNLTDARQTPRYGKLSDRRFDRGDFVFALANPERAPAPKSNPIQIFPKLVFWRSIEDSEDPATSEVFSMSATRRSEFVNHNTPPIRPISIMMTP